MKTLRVFSIVAISLLMAACSVNPVSSVGLYSDDTNNQPVKGSHDQARVTGSADFAPEEVFEAALTAMGRLGYTVDTQNKSTWKITGNYIDIICNNVNPAAVTMAVLARQRNKKPTTDFVIFADRLNVACLGGNIAAQTAIKLKTEMLKVLSTY